MSYDLRRPCLLGGAIESSGTIAITTDTDPERATVDVTATDVHDRCVFLAAAGRITVTGDPDVRTDVHVSSREGEPEGLQTVTVVGAVLWEADDGRAGRCEIDVRVEVDADAERTVASGRLCGHEFSVTVDPG